MNTYRFSEEQRLIWVNEKHNGTKSVKKICREAGISRATLYNWISEFPKPDPAENDSAGETLVSPEQLKGYAKYDASGKYEMLVTALSGIDKTGNLKRKLVQSIVKRFTLTVGQACAIVGLEEEAYGYKPRKPEVDDTLVYDELTRLINEDLTRGFIQCYNIIQGSHPEWTRKQLKRVYRDFRLYLKRSRVRKEKIEQITDKPDRVIRPDIQWNLGFVKGSFDDGNPSNDNNDNAYWILFIVDEADGLLLNASVGSGDPTEEDVIYFLSLAVAQNGKPRKLKVAGISPFNTREMTKWMLEYKVGITTLSMAKPENEEQFRLLNESIASRVETLSSLKDMKDLKDGINSLIIKSAT